MFKSYLITAIRNLKKRKLYTLINLVSLSVGLISFIIIYIYVLDEFNYDTSFKNSERIYRVLSHNNFGGKDQLFSKTPPPLIGILKNEFPEVEQATIVATPPDEVITYDNSKSDSHDIKSFNQTGILAVDSNFFKVFSFALLKGDPSRSFSEPNSVVLTKETALKYFGKEDALGKILIFGTDNQKAFKVTGVLDDFPGSIHMNFEMLTSMSSYPEVSNFDWSWVWNALVTYVVLNEEATPEYLESKFPKMVANHVPGTFEKIRVSYDDFIAGGGVWEYQLQPLEDIRLKSSQIGNVLGPIGDMNYIYIFVASAILILLIACINYINLATAMAGKRSKEIGMRKVLGATKNRLAKQLLFEPVILNLIALVVSVAIVMLFLSKLNDVLGKSFGIEVFIRPMVMFPILLVAVMTGLLAGAYPAFSFTSLNTIEVLKGGQSYINSYSKKNFLNLRKALVIFQFVLSNMLFASALIIKNQIGFIEHSDLGFDRESVLVFPNANKLGNNLDPLKNRLISESFVTDISVSTSLPAKKFHMDWYIPQDSEVKNLEVASTLVDNDYLPTLGLGLIEGRNFSDGYDDSRTIIVNQTFVNSVGWQDPIGKEISAGDDGLFKVIGVVRDFNYISLREKIRPFALFHYSSGKQLLDQKFMSLKIKTNDLHGALNQIEASWHEIVPNLPFDYSFLTDDYNRLYTSEQTLSQIINFFTILCTIISCMGLYGLVSFLVEQKNKEIGVRKVLGASVFRIVMMFLREYAVILVVALLIAVPITYFLMEMWINTFIYNVGLGAFSFIAAGIVTLIIAAITVIVRTVLAARVNPIKSLKSD